MKSNVSRLELPRDEITVAIPTRDSARYLDLILGFYKDQGTRTTVFVDSRSRDGTLDIARTFTEAVSITNCSAVVVEQLIREMSEVCGTKWVLRIDDDELPSLAMLEFVAQAIRTEQASVYGFGRHQCGITPSGTLVCDRDCSLESHRQWRLYQPAKVTFSDIVHTPGIIWGGNEVAIPAPLKACLIHLDWALHTYEERSQKVDRYDSYAADAGTQWRTFYLYEEEEPHAFLELDLTDFDAVAAEIARRFSNLCVGPGVEMPKSVGRRTAVREAQFK